MPHKAEKTDYVGYSKRLNDLCVRLHAAGYRVESSRLAAYRETFTINELLVRENRRTEIEAKNSFPAFLNDFHESNEILEACEGFPDLNAPGLRDRLEKAIRGTEELRHETPNTGEARNYLFELVIASTLKRVGFEVRLDQTGDVLFEMSDGTPCFVECKRVHSQQKLHRRISEAAHQIRKHCQLSHARACGIVAVDVSKLLNPGGDNLFDAPTRDELSLAAEQKVESYGNFHYNTLKSVKEKSVLGIYLYGRLPGAVRQPVGLWMARKPIFIIFHHPSTRSGKLALEFLNRIKSAMDRW